MKKQVEIADLLALIRAGFNLTQIAKKLGFSIEAIRRKTIVLRAKGIIKRVSKSPALFQVIQPEETGLNQRTIQDGGFNLVGSLENPNRVLELHRVENRFLVSGGSLEGALGFSREWRMGRNRLLKRKWAYPSYTVIVSFGKVEKVIIWLKAFCGFSPNQQLVAANRQLREFALDFGNKHGVILEVVAGPLAPELATTTPHEGTSKELLDNLDLHGGGRVKAGDVVISESSSHEGKAQFSSLDLRERPRAAMEYGQQLHKVIVGKVGDRVPVIEAQLKDFGVALAMVLRHLQEQTGEVAVKPIRPEERREII